VAAGWCVVGLPRWRMTVYGMNDDVCGRCISADGVAFNDVLNIARQRSRQAFLAYVALRHRRGRSIVFVFHGEQPSCTAGVV